MIPKNCLSKVLDLCTTENGYFVARASSHSDKSIHAIHASPQGLQHYAPGATLGHPIQALYGFDGVMWERDQSDAPPMHPKAMLIGAWLLAFGITGWYVVRWWKGVIRGLY